MELYCKVYRSIKERKEEENGVGDIKVKAI